MWVRRGLADVVFGDPKGAPGRGEEPQNGAVGPI